MKKYILGNMILLSLSGITSSVSAGTFRDDVEFMVFRDFAENRGPFKAGSKGIPIYTKNGNVLGFFDKAPMPDWSFANRMGVSSLINTGYVSTAAHTKGQNATLSQFGAPGNVPDPRRKTYKSITLNDDTKYDYSFHRLDKLVTEVAPIPYYDTERKNINLLDAKRYPVFARIGSGTQNITDKNGVVQNIAPTRSYLTGGFFGNPTKLDPANSSWSDITVVYSSGSLADYIYKMFPDMLTSRTEGGDSGSPLIVWDSIEEKWYLVGQLYGGHSSLNRWMIPNASLIKNVIDSNTLPEFMSSNNNVINWHYDSTSATGTISQDNLSLHMTGASGNDVAGLDNGKNIVFSGAGGNITIYNDINQGAGSLTFKSDYTVTPDNNETWIGSGINIDEDKTVTWKVNGVKDDSLHKVGKGTLIINGSGKNPGELSVGDGIVILNQQADSQGVKQSFENIDIVSGRPTLILTDSNQIPTGNIFFGFRGGRLDLNGNSLDFKRINHLDSGAQIVNHNSTEKSDLIFSGSPAQYQNDVFLGSLGEVDTSKVNGELSFSYSPDSDAQLLNLQGGTNLNGNMNVAKGKLLLSGAAEHRADGSIYDWNYSLFKADNFIINENANFQVGNFSYIKGNVILENNALASLGYVDSHYTGDARAVTTECTYFKNIKCNPATDDGAMSTFIEGDISLAAKAKLVLGRSMIFSTIQAQSDSFIDMLKDSIFLLRGDSRIAQLNIADNANIKLNGANSDHQFKTLTITQSLTGEGIFSFNVDTSTGESDKLILNGLASGHHNLDLHDITVDHNVQKKATLDLVHLDSPLQSYAPFTISLLNGYFDSGLYRYELRYSGTTHQLFNGILEAQQKPDNNPDLKPTPEPAPTPGPDHGSTEPSQPDNNNSSQQRWISALANGIISDNAARFMTLSNHTQLFHDAVHNSRITENRFWLSTDSSSFSFDNEYVRKWSQSGTTLWMGVDFNPEQDSERLRSGLAFGQNRAKSKFSGSAITESETYSLATYGQFNFDGGYQILAESGVHYYRGSLSLKDQEKNHNTSLNWHYALGGQMTKKLGIVSASSNINLSGVYYNDVKDSVAGYSVESRDTWNHKLSTGLKAEIPMKFNNSVLLTPFVNMKYSKALEKTKTINIEGENFRVQSDNSLKELGTGINMLANNDLSFTLKHTYKAGDDMKRSSGLSLQMDIGF